MSCHGVPEYVLVGGRVCLDEGNLKVVQGHGKFIPTPTHSEFVYNNGTVNCYLLQSFFKLFINNIFTF